MKKYFAALFFVLLSGCASVKKQEKIDEKEMGYLDDAYKCMTEIDRTKLNARDKAFLIKGCIEVYEIKMIAIGEKP